MSIPTRLRITTRNGTVCDNVNLFTISYGQDLRERDVWLRRLRECFADLRSFEPERRLKVAPWFDDVVRVEAKGYDHVFDVAEITL